MQDTFFMTIAYYNLIFYLMVFSKRLKFFFVAILHLCSANDKYYTRVLSHEYL